MVKKNDENKRQTRSQKAGKVWKPTPQLESIIVLKTKIWQKDSHGLFDYEATEDQYNNQRKTIFPFKRKIQKGEKTAKQPEKQSRILICRSKDCKTQAIHINPQTPPTKIQNDLLGVCEILATRQKKKTIFKIRTSLKLENLSSALQREAQKLQNRPEIEQVKKDRSIMNLKLGDKQPEIKVFNPIICPFTVTKRFFKGASNVEGYPLRPGNIIKFGRVQYVVTELKTQNEFISLRSSTDLKDVSGYEGIFQVTHRQDELDHESKSQGYVPTCKVCLCHEETQQNLLISPCKCKGYCGVIHIDCLKQWINSKVKKQHQGLVKSYNFNKFECEICKVPFPQIIKMKDRKIEMMGIQKPDKQYIIIESINPPRSLNPHHREEERCLHVISTNERAPLKIGRGHICDIRISDISVSRAHAEIEFFDGKFLIKDTKSKFGTLILFDEEFELNEKHPLSLQSGRVLYEFSIDKEPMQEENEDDTESQNEEALQNQQNQGNFPDNQANQESEERQEEQPERERPHSK